MNTLYDLAIIGGGPAGAAAGVYASRKKLHTIFITENFEGQSYVSEGIQNWIGTPVISGAALAESFKKHLLEYAGTTVEIKEGNRADSIIPYKTESGEDAFEVKVKNDTYHVRSILLATGSHRRKLEVPGAKEFENKGIVYCASCDGPLFSGLDVVVIGGGNAAFETVAQLLAYCPSVTLLNRSETFRADPVTVEKLSTNPNFHIITNAELAEVKGDKFVNSLSYKNVKTGEIIELPTKGIFVEIGLLPNSDIMKDLADIDDYGKIKVDARTQQTSLKGVWAAGDVTDGIYHQNNIAAGDGVKALEDIYMHLKTR